MFAVLYRKADCAERCCLSTLVSFYGWVNGQLRYYSSHRGLHATCVVSVHHPRATCCREVPGALCVFQVCASHVSQAADTHYRAVCRALVTEALELSTFLDKVSQGKVKSESVAACSDLQKLDISIWVSFSNMPSLT